MTCVDGSAGAARTSPPLFFEGFTRPSPWSQLRPGSQPRSSPYSSGGVNAGSVCLTSTSVRDRSRWVSNGERRGRRRSPLPRRASEAPERSAPQLRPTGSSARRVRLASSWPNPRIARARWGCSVYPLHAIETVVPEDITLRVQKGPPVTVTGVARRAINFVRPPARLSVAQRGSRSARWRIYAATIDKRGLRSFCSNLRFPLLPPFDFAVAGADQSLF
jgi:hypothetical protein